LNKNTTKINQAKSEKAEGGKRDLGKVPEKFLGWDLKQNDLTPEIFFAFLIFELPCCKTPKNAIKKRNKKMMVARP
jgi:hypothetical protein